MIRVGFVSNSSSSSFVCAKCGGIESGYDISLSELDMMQCDYGHIFHDWCANYSYDNLYDDEKILSMMRDDLEYDEETDTELIIEDYIRHYGIPSEYCPFCNGTEIDREELLPFAIELLGTTRDKLELQLKTKKINRRRSSEI